MDLWLPPVLAAALVLATHVPLGQEVIRRGIIFLDLATAQLAALGAVLVAVTLDSASPVVTQAAAFAVALFGAFGFRWVERRFPALVEAVIGVVFVLAVTAVMLVLATDPHGGERLTDLLAGQLLWVAYADLAWPAAVTVAVLLLWRGGAPGPTSAWFFALFAVAVTVSVQLIGVYLVFASLIIPALGAHAHPWGRWLAYAIGAAGYGLGLGTSWCADLPAGPAVVWGLAVAAGVLRMAGAFLIRLA
ncbi:MAG: metal ABC transporter permease [Pseudomonadota bacterium]|nr:metal ABC transporter permease [Pseudomonadota bacterium]